MLGAQPRLDSLPAEAILNAAADGILAVDPAGHIRFVNPAASALLGVPADDLVGEPLRAYIQAEGNGPHGQGEQLCWRADGASLAIEYEVRPVEATGGPVLTFRDISQRRAADRVKDELIAIASHELRSPLTSIRGSLGLLASGNMVQTDATGQRLLDIAVENTERLIRLVNDVLDLERLESGHIRMSYVACDGNDLLIEAANAVRALAHEKQIALHVGGGAAHIWGDRDRLLQVLVNLLANAIKFSPAGSTVWLEAEASNGEVVVSVRDHGAGIAPEKLEVMFDRFVQVHEPGAQRQAGSGLGLAISRGIVIRHGGQIWAESALGAGTTLYVALPAEPAIPSPRASVHDDGAFDAAA